MSKSLLIGLWCGLLASAACYYWWSTYGEWLKHTESTLLAHDAVRYGKIPTLLMLVWFIVFLMCLLITVRRLGPTLFESRK
jgi:hypothetical protein